MDNDLQPPEAALIEQARHRLPKNRSAVSKVAKRARISEGRWRQIAKGYQQATKETRVPVRAPADTLARMAEAVDVSADELEAAGRSDAAEIIREQSRRLARGLASLIPTDTAEVGDRDTSKTTKVEYTMADERAVLESSWSTATQLTKAVLDLPDPPEQLLAAARRVVFDISGYLIIRILSSEFAPLLERWLARIYSEREKLYRQLSRGAPVFPWETDVTTASNVVDQWANLRLSGTAQQVFNSGAEPLSRDAGQSDEMLDGRLRVAHMTNDSVVSETVIPSDADLTSNDSSQLRAHEGEELGEFLDQLEGSVSARISSFNARIDSIDSRIATSLLDHYAELRRRAAKQQRSGVLNSSARAELRNDPGPESVIEPEISDDLYVRYLAARLSNWYGTDEPGAVGLDESEYKAALRRFRREFAEMVVFNGRIRTAGAPRLSEFAVAAAREEDDPKEDPAE
jgi:hypothetical protein